MSLTGNDYLNLVDLSDINECLTDNVCAEQCVNTEGSYHCTCNQSGYELIHNQATCEGTCIYMKVFVSIMEIMFMHTVV